MVKPFYCYQVVPPILNIREDSTEGVRSPLVVKRGLRVYFRELVDGITKRPTLEPYMYCICPVFLNAANQAIEL